MDAATKAEQQDPHAEQTMPESETVEDPGGDDAEREQPDQPEEETQTETPEEPDEGDGDEEGDDDSGDDASGTEGKKVPQTQSRAGRARAAGGQRKRQAPRKNGGDDPKAKARLELQGLTEQNRKKGHTAPMQKKARDLAKIAGVDVPAWAKATGSKSGSDTPRRESDPDLILAHKATALATGGSVAKDGTLTVGDTKFGAPVNTTQVKAMHDALKGKGTDLPEEARKRLRELNGTFPSKMKMWARKDAAIAVVIHEERQASKRRTSAPAKSKDKTREPVPA
jgi:hypothetical protein